MAARVGTLSAVRARFDLLAADRGTLASAAIARTPQEAELLRCWRMIGGSTAPLLQLVLRLVASAAN